MNWAAQLEHDERTVAGEAAPCAICKNVHGPEEPHLWTSGKKRDRTAYMRTYMRNYRKDRKRRFDLLAEMTKLLVALRPYAPAALVAKIDALTKQAKAKK